MKIRPALPALLGPARQDAAALLRRLQLGQELQARVLDMPRPGLARLQIGLTELLAQTRASLAPGTPLRLRVARLDPLPELKVLQDPPRLRPADALLRSALPRQLPVSEALQSLARALGGHPQPLPPEVRRLGSAVLQRLHTPQGLDASAVQARFLGSGLFLEARLALGGEVPTDDLKVALLQLLRRLQGERAGARTTMRSLDGGAAPTATPPTEVLTLERLGALLEGAVARIQSHQVASLPGEAGDRPGWQFELPLLVGGEPQTVLIRIARECPKGPTATTPPAPGWNVTLRFDLPTLGPVHAEITVAGERVSSLFWCEREHARARLAATLPVLETALARVGLTVEHLGAVQGVPPVPLEPQRPSARLLDTRA